jgi:hypothetical protein
MKMKGKPELGVEHQAWSKSEGLRGDFFKLKSIAIFFFSYPLLLCFVFLFFL